MKRFAVLAILLACAIMTASAAPGPAVGVFIQADTSCPPANFALFGPCVTILSTDPVVCGHPLIGYAMLSKSDLKKLNEIGNFVTLHGVTTEEDVCGQP